MNRTEFTELMDAYRETIAQSESEQVSRRMEKQCAREEHEARLAVFALYEAALVRKKPIPLTWADLNLRISEVSRGSWDGKETRSFNADALLSLINQLRVEAATESEAL